MEDLNIQEKDRYTIITFSEKLVTGDATSMKSGLLALNGKGKNNFILDMKKVVKIDSSGISMLLVANRICINSAGQCLMVNVSPVMKSVLQIAYVDRIFTIEDTVEEAVKYFEKN